MAADRADNRTNVQPSEIGTQPVGEAAEVASGVFQLKVPVPVPLGFVSAYLISGPEGWTLLDTGFDYPDGRAAWEAGAASIGLDLRRDVCRILVSHFHPDHLGAARWLQELSGAPVCMLGEEIENSRRLGHGAGRVVPSPGHADYQYMLHDDERGILFAADHVLLKITPNIGLWPESLPHPLARYMQSLYGLRSMNANLVLPGHGPIFHDLAGRIDELMLHHEERLGVMHAEIQNGPRTPFEVSGAVFRETLTLYERCFALAETLAHLDHLVLQGGAEKIEGDAVRFRAT
jgi:glyoxylase-like metal-dependent hydrolase (beta-lactamase superfamily II)